MKKIEIQPGLNVEDLVFETRSEDIVLTKNGQAVALVSEFDDDELYWYIREHDPAFIESIAQARKDVAEGKTISHEDLLREFGLDES
jgi:hypothetical protein